MIIFVYGENTYLSLQKVTLMRDQFKVKFDPSGMNLVEFPAVDNAKIDLAEVRQATQTPPFLSEKRMVIVKELLADLKKAEAKNWLEALGGTPESTILIFWDNTAQKKIEKSELITNLKSRADVHSYPQANLTGSQLTAWAANFIASIDLKLSAGQLQKIIALVGNDLWQLSAEFQKLKAYSLSQPIDDESIALLVKANFEDQIFQFIDAVSNGNSKLALRLLDEQRHSGANDFQLFSMLARQIRILIGARSLLDKNPVTNKNEFAKAMKLHPYVAEKSLQQAKKMNFEYLQGVHGLIVEYDRKMKMSGITPELAVDRIVTEMVRS